MSLELVESPQPYFIPGYTGHCPQYKYREGATYGSQTHKLLLDPTTQHAEFLVLSDRTAGDYQVSRKPAQVDVNIVESRFQHGDPIYRHPMQPGYEGSQLQDDTEDPCLTDQAVAGTTLSNKDQQSIHLPPLMIKLPEKSKLIHPSEIYHQNEGQIPNYMGHIPGAMFRFGKTYGHDTRDAKRWLRAENIDA